jgi:hypothetical protein
VPGPAGHAWHRVIGSGAQNHAVWTWQGRCSTWRQAMTRFDRFWEPFLVIVAGLMIFIGTL